MTSQTDVQTNDLEFTGERFMPEVAGQIAFEHLHRYHFASRFCQGKRVLDVACGEGYGSRILSNAASSVVGVDISADAVAHAQGKYASGSLEFVEASAASLPLPDDSFDVVVSFETIEHHDQHEEMLSEIRRVLRPGGLLVLSSPNKQYYSIEPGYSNPYHVKELFREELLALAGRYFSAVQVYSQRVVHGSLLIAEGKAAFDSILGTGPDSSESERGLSRPLYDLILASDGELPEAESSFYEMKVHGLDAATFYGVHLLERVSNADHQVAALQAKIDGQSHDELLRQLLRQHEALRGVGEQVRHLEGLLATSQQTLLTQFAGEGALRDELARLVAQHNEDREEVQQLQLAVTEQRLIGEQREREVQLLKESRSWRYTGWLRRLTGSARRHL
ncbi:TPA: methyltransferase domain-containing protein [Stenotrophomonas maltophilia]|nr:methyltransferase domain-containing protein [Stenotrophomonas maltophilia]HDS1025771.1 methyltransferase domain-containing protein [Stenotrophomonas maltophilia]HDS1029915.1 methyltransferase domain-containing protein [Stenotrophomonas maltophilia]HDS1034463.1 methyltransferase domain-containing protein [Stenotrophomonas maltophilia]HDS1038550.1 methyltransferase domain-containing protein [Stenotrophomonas maltophilia]